MSEFKLTTPVAFIIFNRPDTTALVFAEIAKARPPKLLVVGDGPRAHKAGEAERVTATRAIIEQIDWPCEVLTHFSETNLGCKKRVSSGIDWVFEQVEEAIILEDDCLPDPSFFRFCQDMLAKYRSDERILMISGTNLSHELIYEDDYYFSRYPHIWGWASWRRVWRYYDVEMKDLDSLLSNENFRRSFENKEEFNHWVRNFLSVKSNQVDTWDAQVVFLAFVKAQLTIFPAGNLITNIGFGPEATHTLKPNSWLANIPLKSMLLTGKNPNFFLQDRRAEKLRKMKEGIGVSRIFRYTNYLISKMRK